MIRTTITLLIIAVTLAACGNPQGYSSQAPTGQGKPPQVARPQEEAQDKVIFKGEYITLIESVQSNLEKLPLAAPTMGVCLRRADERTRGKLTSLGFKGDTKYFRLNGEEKDALERRGFTLRVSKEQAAKMSPDLLKGFDSAGDGIDSTELYFLKNNIHEYLLMVGHNVGASGYGHYYRVHILLPLAPNKPLIEFHSVTNDPRKIRIGDTGKIYYVQIDSKHLGAVTDADARDFPVTVSLFTYDGESHKELEVDSDCRDLLD